MFNFKLFYFKRLVPILSVLFVTAVILAQSETGSVILEGIQIIVNVQPQGF